METFWLRVIASDRVFFEGRCQKLIIPAPDGEKGVLAHHENMLIAVENGELHLQTKEGEWMDAIVSKGFAEIMNNRVSVLVSSAEKPEEIDVRRAEEAKERAQEQLRQKQSIQEYQISQASLARAMARLKNAKHWDR
ncbi:MAG: ATP synthase F1 subunit epsilon [Lachnospiraceae bacterium]